MYEVLISLNHYVLFAMYAFKAQPSNGYCVFVSFQFLYCPSSFRRWCMWDFEYHERVNKRYSLFVQGC